MKTSLAILIATILGTSSVTSLNVSASTLSEFQTAIKEGKTDLNLRYRYERVDQDGMEKNANASTLRTRLTYQSGDFNGLFTKLEVDNVTAIGNENYNSTANGNSQYPVVADPTDTDLNQAFIGYKSGNMIFSVGRQRINHNDQRFVGGVGWRQNEQTYDGYRVQYDDKTNLSVDFSYVYNVNRIFGPDGDRADLGGDISLLNANYQIDKGHRLTGFVYNLDFDTALALSSRTVGISYDGKFSGIKLHASYAKQNDIGDNPIDYSADYWTLEAGTKISSVSVAAGYESLGSDNGRGFTTPLATLHKFQGFADKFLTTPGSGVNDLYLKASGKVGKLTLAAIWHKLDSDVDNIDYGKEINLVAKYPLADKVGLLVKYANYSADDFSADTNKLWGMLTFSF